MKQIVLNSVCLEGFRSYAEPTIVTLTSTAGLKFVAGDNRVEPTLESNGAGKSTVFDAICWCLYGTSVKGLRASDLLTRGHRGMQVMLILEIDGAVVAVKRTSPPNRLTIDGEPVEQEEVDRLVGLNRSRFLNSVIFGQAVPLFLDLSMPHRGDLLDDVLGLEVWLLAAGRATDRHGDKAAELTHRQLQIERLQGQLQGLPDIAALQQQEDAWQADRDSRLGELIQRYEVVEAEIKAIKVPLHTSTVEATEARERYREQQAVVANLESQRAGMQSEHARLIRDIEWLRDNDTCPTCHQKIAAKFSRDQRNQYVQAAETLNNQIAQTMRNIVTEAHTADALEEAWQSTLDVTNRIEAQRQVIIAQVDAKRRESDDLQRQAIRVRNEKNPFTDQRQRAVEDSFRLRAAIDQEQGLLDQATVSLNAYNFWRQGFRRVRLFCLDNVLRELAVETKNALSVLGLNGWQMFYTTATETKSGTMRLGVQVAVEPPGADAGIIDILSCGEGQRCRLAASLGLASLVQRWAGVRFNFEVWDEPTNWLSARGVEDLLDALVYRAEAQDKSILLADHRSLAHSGFAEQYLVTKDDRGSSWERV
jgi:DNA repair exonuclease SbcCD ATPase subunit